MYLYFNEPLKLCSRICRKAINEINIIGIAPDKIINFFSFIKGSTGLSTTLGICAVGDFICSSPPATAAERRTKVEILLNSSMVKVKLGQKAQ